MDLEQDTTQAPFDAAAVDVLRHLRRACALVLGSCGGIERAVDVTSRLGLDRSLGWKVFQVAQGGGVCPSVAHIPGRQGFRQFLEASRRVGVPEDVLSDAAQAFDRFRALTALHAGDRASGDILLSPLSDEGRRRFELTLRRDSFRSQAHFLGVQAHAVYQLDVVHRPQPGRMPDVARVRGLYGLRRNRADVSWIIAKTTLVHDDGPSATIQRRPLSGAQRSSNQPGDDASPLLLTQFCSSPALPVRRRILGGTTAEDELLPGSVGQLAAIDVVTGEFLENMPRRDVTTDATIMQIATPAERACYDVLLPAEVPPPTVRMHSTIQAEHPYLRGETFGTIPMFEPVEHLGQADSAPIAPDVPGHRELMQWTIARLGLDPKRFLLWRVRLRFPPVPSCLAMTYRVPGAG